MTSTQWALVIAATGLGTYALRAAPFLSRRLYRLGQDNLRFMTYVSFAVAAGIVSRSIVFTGGNIGAPSEMSIKVAAVAAALLLYRLVKNVPVALFLGAGLAVLLKWLTT